MSPPAPKASAGTRPRASASTPRSRLRRPTRLRGTAVQAVGLEKLDLSLEKREIPGMKTLTVDDSKRIRIPDAEPRQVFAYTQNGDGSITLMPVKAKRKERFPRGSLLKYMTAERDAEQLAILSGCVQGPE